METLVKLFVAIISFFEKLKEDLEDGKISRTEAWGLVTNAITGLWGPVTHWGEIKDALKLIKTDPSAREELRIQLKEEFDLDDEVLEKRIEDGLDLLDHIYTYIRSWFPPEEEV